MDQTEEGYVRIFLAVLLWDALGILLEMEGEANRAIFQSPRFLFFLYFALVTFGKSPCRAGGLLVVIAVLCAPP